MDGITGIEDQKRDEEIVCPECVPGAAMPGGHPHDEPDKPHIHLTTYGYLLYAPSHEQLDFVREIREIERRAGREDAARKALDRLKRERERAEVDKRGREQDNDSEGVMCCVQYIDGLSIGINVLSQELDQAGSRGDGVQPTEEQRAGNEDQKPDCSCEYVDIGIGWQKVAEDPECPRCTPLGRDKEKR